MPWRVRTIRVSGEMRLMTWTLAKILGKKRYEVATVEKKMERNESSLKLRASIPMSNAKAKKKKMTGMRGSMIIGDALIKKLSPVQITIMPIR